MHEKPPGRLRHPPPSFVHGRSCEDRMKAILGEGNQCLYFIRYSQLVKRRSEMMHLPAGVLVDSRSAILCLKSVEWVRRDGGISRPTSVCGPSGEVGCFAGAIGSDSPDCHASAFTPMPSLWNQGRVRNPCRADTGHDLSNCFSWPALERGDDDPPWSVWGDIDLSARVCMANASLFHGD